MTDETARHPATALYWPRLVLSYALAALAGWFFSRLHMPLPWMMGPLLMTAGLALTGVLRKPLPVRTRPFGQAVVATTVGLSFTEEALAVVLELLPLLIGMAMITTVLAMAVSVVQARLAGVRLSRMMLATFPIAPVEAAVIAEGFGVPPAPVIMAQSLRIAAIVLVVPTLLFAVDGFSRPDAVIGADARLDDPLLLLLPLSALAGAMLFRRLGWANPFFLGPLSVTAALTACGIVLPHYPPIILIGAQLILGSWLGSVFQPGILRSAGRELTISMLGTMVLLVLIGGAALLLARITPVDIRSLLLGIVPGGVTEMALTAQFLHQNVAVVTAAQIVRIFVLMPLARPLIRWTERIG